MVKLNIQDDLKVPEAIAAVRPSGTRLYKPLKRVLDIMVSVSIIAVTLPLSVMIALSIKLDSRGPIIFRQTRIGTDAREFVMYKFRTMEADSDDATHREEFRRYVEGLPLDHDRHGPLYKKIADPRITRVGRFLRATNLDELPQLMNVLRGHMSMVGPRPMLSYQLELYKPWYHQRHQVPQGITGLWQLKGRNRVDLKDMVQLDLEYIKRRSLWLDLWLMVGTIPSMLCGPKGSGEDGRDKA